MKNITISVDDETYRAARIHAAELGTSISALVKTYLNNLPAPSAAEPVLEVREIQAHFALSPPVDGPPWLIAGKWVWTRGGKPRQPGALRAAAGAASGDLDDAWPADVLASFEAWDEGDFDPIP